MTGKHDDPALDDGVRRLMRLAAAPPEVPAAHFDAAKAAAREHWQRELRRRARRRRHWTFAGLAAAAVLVAGLVLRLALEPGGAGGHAVAQVEGVRGNVNVTRAGEAARVALASGQPVFSQAVLDLGPNSGAALRMTGGPSLRIDEGTRLRLESASTVFLEGGTVYFDAAKDASGVVVLTSFGRVQDFGTQFEVSVSRVSMRVRVREGQVVVDGKHGREPIAAGVELTVGTAGLSRKAIGRHEAAWDWAEALAPPPEIEGGTALAFLGWATRELGLELAFEGDDARRRAEESVLHGTIDGLTPDEALLAVLPTSGLGHRVERDRLVVSEIERPD